MASLVLKMSVSLDGYVAPTDGSTDWVAAGRSDDGASWTVETLSNAGAHLIGGTTYAAWAGYWPGASGPFAKPMNEIPKVVFSNSLASADWGETTIATGDLAEAIMRLKEERSDGYLLAHGGTRFARSLVETGQEVIANGRLADLLRRTAAFGLTLVRLDVRQHADRHTAALDAFTRHLGLGSYAEWPESKRAAFLTESLSDPSSAGLPALPSPEPEVADVLETLQTIADIHPESLGAYVVSMAQAPSDVLAVVWLQRQGRPG